MLEKKQVLFNAWVDAVVNNDRDILKLSSGGLLLVGSLIQFISFPTSACVSFIITAIYVLSACAFLVSLVSSLYKLKINANYLLEFGTDAKDKEESLKSQIKLYEKFMYWSFVIGMFLTVIFMIFLFVFGNS